MSAQFLRLYRAIDDSALSLRPHAHGLPALRLQERLGVLAALGFETGGAHRDACVLPPRHHGKTARRRLLVRRTHPPLPALRPPMAPAVEAEATSSSTHSAIASSARSAVKYAQPATSARPRPELVCAHSAHRWAKQELDKLVEIYYSMAEPQCPEVLLGFLKSVAARFRVFYPLRSEQEVVDRVRTMRQRKQMKRAGETRYWKAMQSKTPVS